VEWSWLTFNSQDSDGQCLLHEMHFSVGKLGQGPRTLSMIQIWIAKEASIPVQVKVSSAGSMAVEAEGALDAALRGRPGPFEAFATAATGAITALTLMPSPRALANAERDAEYLAVTIG
jgi:hypothetical protein